MCVHRESASVLISFFSLSLLRLQTKRYLVLSDPLAKNADTSLAMEVKAGEGGGFGDLPRELAVRVRPSVP